jgi:hypothetical protein
VESRGQELPYCVSLLFERLGNEGVVKSPGFEDGPLGFSEGLGEL